jgi:hypothetical protein
VFADAGQRRLDAGFSTPESCGLPHQPFTLPRQTFIFAGASSRRRGRIRRLHRLCRFSQLDRPSTVTFRTTVAITTVLGPCPCHRRDCALATGRGNGGRRLLTWAGNGPRGLLTRPRLHGPREWGRRLLTWAGNGPRVRCKENGPRGPLTRPRLNGPRERAGACSPGRLRAAQGNGQGSIPLARNHPAGC